MASAGEARPSPASPVDGNTRTIVYWRPSVSTAFALPTVRNQQVVGSSPTAGSRIAFIGRYPMPAHRAKPHPLGWQILPAGLHNIAWTAHWPAWLRAGKSEIGTLVAVLLIAVLGLGFARVADEMIEGHTRAFDTAVILSMRDAN